jgi:MFS family permease
LQHAPREKVISPVFLLVTFATFAYFLAVGAIIPTLPRYVEGPLQSGSVSVGLAMGAFALTAVVLRPLVGRISDSRGRRILIIFGGTVVGATIVGYAVTESMPGLIVLRLLTGVGEAGFYVGVASVVNDLAPESRRGEAISYFSLALFMGLALGPVVGESTLEAIGFDAVWILAGVSAVIAGLAGIFVPDTRPPQAAEASGAPLLNRAALKPGTVLATHIWSLATFSSFIPLYALSLGLSGSRFVFALHSVLILAIRSLGARLPDRLGPRRAAVFALTFTAMGLAILSMWASPAGLYAGAVAFSLGHALAFPALMTLAIRGAPPAERGSVVGTFTAFFDGAFGVGAISAGVLADALGYRGAFAGAAVVAVVGLGVLSGFRRDKEPSKLEPAVDPAASR